MATMDPAVLRLGAGMLAWVVVIVVGWVVMEKWED